MRRRSRELKSDDFSSSICFLAYRAREDGERERERERAFSFGLDGDKDVKRNKERNGQQTLSRDQKRTGNEPTREHV